MGVEFWRTIKASWRSAIVAAALCVSLGLALLSFDFGQRLVTLSYDLLFPFLKKPVPREVQIIYMDDASFSRLGQPNTANWDRNLHAQLIDRLTADGCKLVVFDIVFSQPGAPEANTNLARAIQRNGKVILAAAVNFESRPQIKMKDLVRPLAEFEEVAAGSGVAEVILGPGNMARQYSRGTHATASLPVAAAGIARPAPSFLNFYGPALTLPNISYHEVSDQPAGYFTNQFVFIGARPRTLGAHDEVDEFRTPFALWTGDLTPGVEITATAFLNILRHDGLVRLAASREYPLIIIGGLLFGALLSVMRPARAAGVAIISVAMVLFIAVQVAQRHVWFGWTVIAAGQIPCALAWGWRNHFYRMKFEKDVLERTLTGRASAPGSLIPDHALIRRIGQGAYGEVWLARNAVGVFHAVKIVRRRDFPEEAPYEREFKGIQKFMPISRSHAGFVHLLHVGRNDAEGFFFYIMEAGDDATAGPRIDPEHYSPRTLTSDLARRGQLPPEECLQLALALTLALQHLHHHGLVHRDIKPGNIIYVSGAPKFADIGLVTELRAPGQRASMLGTEGYIAPEGPGTAGADVYSLGKMLYEATMGRDRLLFPEVPTAVLEQPNDTLLRQLLEVIYKACATDRFERYQTAQEMHADLQRLQNLART